MPWLTNAVIHKHNKCLNTGYDLRLESIRDRRDNKNSRLLHPVVHKTGRTREAAIIFRHHLDHLNEQSVNLATEHRSMDVLSERPAMNEIAK